jgi:hypothetical protein
LGARYGKTHGSVTFDRAPVEYCVLLQVQSSRRVWENMKGLDLRERNAKQTQALPDDGKYSRAQQRIPLVYMKIILNEYLRVIKLNRKRELLTDQAGA